MRLSLSSNLAAFFINTSFFFIPIAPSLEHLFEFIIAQDMEEDNSNY